MCTAPACRMLSKPAQPGYATVEALGADSWKDRLSTQTRNASYGNCKTSVLFRHAWPPIGMMARTGPNQCFTCFSQPSNLIACATQRQSPFVHIASAIFDVVTPPRGAYDFCNVKKCTHVLAAMAGQSLTVSQRMHVHGECARVCLEYTAQPPQKGWKCVSQL